ncbi:MAG TPA: hypothetical protein VD913_02230, partial [bacterium]|nr:hypothetical protein [bacterium]
MTRAISRNGKMAEYAELKRRVKETLILGQQRIEQEKVRTYWETGKLIREHELKNRNRSAVYGKELIARLAHDLGISE